MKKYAGLLIRAIRHPRQAYCRLSSAISVTTAELSTAAVSAKDAQIAKLSSTVQKKDARIAQLTSKIFANISVTPAFCRKLHVGCGNVKLPGWLNIDVEPGADLVIDVRQGLPFEENSVDFIYNEHFVEHLTYEEGEKVLREFWRCLKKGGGIAYCDARP